MKINQFILFLHKKGYELSDIYLILEGYFNLTFIEILTSDINLDEDKVKNVIYKLEQNYPPCYLAGFVNIRNTKIFVSEDTLIPRTETVEFIYNEVKNKYDLNNSSVLDLCTGSGVIAILIKKLFPKCYIDASDISKKALELAKKSIEYNNLEINLLESNYFDNINKKYDFIISNPPYIEEDNKDINAPFEPEIALFSGKDGLDSYRYIFSSLNYHLNENGIAFFEIESTNYNNTISLVKKILPTYKIKIYKDIENKERYLILKK